MKKAILSCLMLMGVLSVSAQEQKGTTEYVFEPHWYLQLQGGAQYTTGEAKFGDMISPTIQGAVGYQFSKTVGARLGINAWQSKTGWKDDAGFIPQNFKYSYFAPALDLTFDLSNIIAGFNPNEMIKGVKINFLPEGSGDEDDKLTKKALKAITTFEMNDYVEVKHKTVDGKNVTYQERTPIRQIVIKQAEPDQP